jgi:hypothetical protein
MRASRRALASTFSAFASHTTCRNRALTSHDAKDSTLDLLPDLKEFSPIFRRGIRGLVNWRLGHQREC